LHRVNILLRTEILLDLSIAKSELEYLTKHPLPEFKNLIPRSGNDLRYLNTFFKALRCLIDRLLKNKLSLPIAKEMSILVIIISYI
jgi:hypothetical protein